MTGTRIYLGAEVGGGVDYRTPVLQPNVKAGLRLATTDDDGIHSATKLYLGNDCGISTEVGRYINLTPRARGDAYLGVYPYGKVEGNIRLADFNKDDPQRAEVYGTDAKDVMSYYGRAAAGGELYFHAKLGKHAAITAGAFADAGARYDGTLPVNRYQNEFEAGDSRLELIRNGSYKEQPVETKYYNNGAKFDWEAGGRAMLEVGVGCGSIFTIGVTGSNQRAEASVGIKF